MSGQIKHTPGPWMISGPSKPTAETPQGGDYAILDGGTNIIAEAFQMVGTNQTRDAEANARLIAAAPDLLEAAKRMADLLDYLLRIGAINPNLIIAESIRNVLPIHRAAIVKAIGGQQ